MFDCVREGFAARKYNIGDVSIARTPILEPHTQPLAK